MKYPFGLKLGMVKGEALAFQQPEYKINWYKISN